MPKCSMFFLQINNVSNLDFSIYHGITSFMIEWIQLLTNYINWRYARYLTYTSAYCNTEF